MPGSQNTQTDSGKLPTLVTLRAARALRDEGIRYAYQRAGLYAGLILGPCISAGATYCVGDPTHPTALIFSVAGLLLMALGAFVGTRATYPQTPRLTLEEIERMRDDMGLPPSVFRQTHDNVLHGSPAEHQAAATTDELLSRLQKRAER